jgi:hypothetical protein
MRAILLTVAPAVIVLGGGLAARAQPAAAAPDMAPRWEYRVVTEEQLKVAGKNDLAAGLNRLGDEGWELVAVRKDYIFKRPRGQDRQGIEELRAYIAVAEAEVEQWKNYISWSERMVKKGYLGAQRLESDRLELRKAEITLEQARRELASLPATPKKPAPETLRLPK